MYRYSVHYRHAMSRRIYRVTVTAKDPDDARRMAAIRDPQYEASVSVQRRGQVVEPESADPLTQAKAREYATWRDTEVEVI